MSDNQVNWIGNCLIKCILRKIVKVLCIVIKTRKSFPSEALLNTLRPRQDGRHFADDIFKSNFLTEDMWIVLDISLKYISKGSINNIPALVQIMAWRPPGDKPLSEPMMVSLPTHICVNRSQWVNVYNTLIFPHISYGIQTWGTAAFIGYFIIITS